MNFNIKPKRYYIATAIISGFSLILFLTNGVFTNVGNLITSSFIGLLPFVIDDLVFLDDTMVYKEDKVFKGLRALTILDIVLIVVIGVVWIFKSMDVFVFPDATNFTYLIVNADGYFGRFDLTLISEILSVDTVLTYYIVTFIASVLLRFLNAYFYRSKIEKIKKK